MKKIYVILFLLISVMIFGETKSLSSINNLEFKVIEKVKINNKDREKKYNIIFTLPNKVKKEIIYPKINKGEVYIYNNSKKIIYLPAFDEYKETKIDGEENRIIQAINEIINLEKHDKNFRNKYLKKQKQTIFLDEYTKIKLNKYIKVQDYVLPEKIEIEDSFNNMVGTIFLENIKVNQNIDDEVFILKSRENK